MRVLSVLFGLFVILNVVISQWYPASYFRGLVNERAMAVPYLKNIQTLPEFPVQLQEFTSAYGPSIKEDLYYDESVRNKYIQELEQLREKNPASRDVYYQLSVLYRQNGETQKSSENLQKAREIDPSI